MGCSGAIKLQWRRWSNLEVEIPQGSAYKFTVAHVVDLLYGIQIVKIHVQSTNNSQGQRAQILRRREDTACHGWTVFVFATSSFKAGFHPCAPFISRMHHFLRLKNLKNQKKIGKNALKYLRIPYEGCTDIEWVQNQKKKVQTHLFQYWMDRQCSSSARNHFSPELVYFWRDLRLFFAQLVKFCQNFLRLLTAFGKFNLKKN